MNKLLIAVAVGFVAPVVMMSVPPLPRGGTTETSPEHVRYASTRGCLDAVLQRLQDPESATYPNPAGDGMAYDLHKDGNWRVTFPIRANNAFGAKRYQLAVCSGDDGRILKVKLV